MRRPGRLAAVAAAVLLAGACTTGSGGVTQPAPATPTATLTPAVPTPAGPKAGSPAGGSSAAGPVASGSGAAHAENWDVSQMSDPCLTVSRVEVTAVTGLKVSDGTTLDSWPPLCAFTVTGPQQEYLYVSADSRDTARGDYNRQRSDSQATRAVAGIGDQAYWLPEFTALHVFAGTTHLTVKFAGSAPPADAIGKAMALARVALS